MNLYAQALIAEKRGELHLAILLRDIVREKHVSRKEKEKAKKVVFHDADR